MKTVRLRKKSAYTALFMVCMVLFGLTTGGDVVRSLNPEDSLIPVDYSFTYQGYLEVSGSPVDGTCDFQFNLYDAATGGNNVGPASIVQTLAVDRGVFSTELDFGNKFAQHERWLSVAVRCPAGSGSYTTLSPRTKITAAPVSNAMPNVTLDPTSGHIGINNSSFPIAYWLDVNGDIRSRESMLVTSSTGAVRAKMGSNGNGGTITVQSGSGVIRGEMGITFNNTGFLTLDNNSGAARVQLGVLNTGEGYLDLNGSNGQDNIVLSTLSGAPNNGYVAVKNSSGNNRAGIFTDSNGAGYLFTTGPNGNSNVTIQSLDANKNHGFIRVRNSSGASRVNVFVGSEGSGRVFTFGPNGQPNAGFGTSSSNDNNGWMGIYDTSGLAQAGAYINNSGQGVIFGDVKNFAIENPNDPETDIWYASLEGPEAAAYIRGTAELVNGQAVITFPDHFLAVASEQEMTVQVTPLSADSLGLAVVEKSLEGVVVRELHNGSGNYEFDFYVTAVRQGYENFEVIRPVSERLQHQEGLEVENNSHAAEPPGQGDEQ